MRIHDQLICSLTMIILAGSIGCLGSPQSQQIHTMPPVAAGPPIALGFVFATMEAAAIDALANAHFDESFADRNRLRMATIHRVSGGFSWSEAQVSRSGFDSRTRNPKIRHRMSRNDVATWIVHPHTGDSRLDRINERLNKSERQIVDRLDPHHRPIFLLTPSLKIVKYEHEKAPDSIAELPRERLESELMIAGHE